MCGRFRYSKGFGVAKYLLGEQSVLNAPNCVIGIFFYLLQFILGNYHYMCNSRSSEY